MNLSRLPDRAAFAFFLASIPFLAGALQLPDKRLVSSENFEQGEAINGYGYLWNFDGELMPWSTQATNLVDVIDINSAADAYVYDLEEGTWDLISRKYGQPNQTANGSSGTCCASADGRYVLIGSGANDLVEGHLGTLHPQIFQVYLFDRETRAATLLSHVPGQPNRGSAFSSSARAISADGQLAIFTSTATDLIAASGTNHGSVFLFERASGQLSLIGHAAGSPSAFANGETYLIGFSEDLRYFALSTSATDLVAGVTDTNGTRDVYLYDRLENETTLVTHAAGATNVAAGGSAFDFSADGRYLLVVSKALLAPGMIDGNQEFLDDCFLWDRQTNVFRLLTHHFADPTRGGDRYASCHGFSRDARYIYVDTSSTDMIPGYVAGSGSHIYLIDRDGGGKTLVSHAWNNPSQGSDGTNGSVRISRDGRFAVYQSYATNLESGIVDENGDHDVYRYDRLTNQSTLVSRIGSSNVAGRGYSMGRVDLEGKVVFSAPEPLDPGAVDDNGTMDAFVFGGDGGGEGEGEGGAAVRLLTGATIGGKMAAGSGSWGISDDSRWIFWDDHLHDQRTGRNLRVAHRAGSPEIPANGASIPRGISSDDRYVLLESMADDLAAGIFDGNARSDVYRYDRETAAAVLISRSTSGAAITASGGSTAHWLSADGKRAVLGSPGWDLAPNGFGGADNLYLWDESSPGLARISHPHSSTEFAATGDSYFEAISEDERFVLYRSTSTELVPHFTDTNGGAEPDIFLYDRAVSQAALVNRQAGAGNPGLPGVVGVPYANGDWSFVYFASTSGNPASTSFLRWGRGAAQVEQLFSLSHCPLPGTSLAGITPDGRYLLVSTSCPVYPTDVNGLSDVYLYDRVLEQFELVSHWPGNPQSPLGGVVGKSLSRDGVKVLFQVAGSGDQVVYHFDRARGQLWSFLTSYFTPTFGIAVQAPILSRDGNYVVMGTLSAAAAPFDANRELDAFVGDLGSLFIDGFESGNTSAWSQTVP